MIRVASCILFSISRLRLGAEPATSQAGLCHLSPDICSLFSDGICPLTSDKSLRPLGTGYGFRQNSMYLIQQAARIRALWKRLPLLTLQTGAFDKIADFKIELIV